MGNMFVSSGVYSIALFFVSLLMQVTIYVHYKKPKDVRFSAGMHYNLAKFEGILNFGMDPFYALFSRPTFRYNAEPCPDNIRPIVYPILIGLTILGAFSNITSAYITYKSAKRTRGTEMVLNPDYRVPAWMLAGTEESQGHSEGHIRL
ncbi:hypothetical protein CPB84DRAFT_1781132 [Gymnopilus junonius]|uniref:Uncharacterized protein n=1 Tax=Gymnopilus junonius TaxID=109634 RepID=A0A9P5NM69_GYMJU|nr:hypothetical protein CPB84DRAFT_1781132 [Gymnopilus junonius]